MSDPEPFDGNLDLCRGFLLQCGLVFAQRPASFFSDASKTRYVLGLLRGRALAWAEAASSHEDFCSLPFAEFKAKLSTVFDHPNYGGDAAARLLKLKQGTRAVADYAVEFWTLAAERCLKGGISERSF